MPTKKEKSPLDAIFEKQPLEVVEKVGVDPRVEKVTRNIVYIFAELVKGGIRRDIAAGMAYNIFITGLQMPAPCTESECKGETHA